MHKPPTPYSEIRHAAFRLTQEVFEQAIPPVQVWLTDVDRAAIHAWSTTWAGLHPSGYGAFEWGRIAAKYGHRPRNFQAALWADGILCALAVGTLQRDHSRLSLDYLARKQNDPNPLAGEVTGIVTAAALYYCAALDVPLLEISNPAPGLERRYRAAGFTLAYNRGLTRYLARTLD
jgi:hypothetical protein